MTKLCQCCSKRYLCKEVDTKEECNKFKSWRETKNYGEVKRQKEEKITGNFNNIMPKIAKKLQILIKCHYKRFIPLIDKLIE